MNPKHGDVIIITGSGYGLLREFKIGDLCLITFSGELYWVEKLFPSNKYDYRKDDLGYYSYEKFKNQKLFKLAVG